jgi:hypothetical protein
MSGHPEREGGEGGGATLQHGNPNSSIIRNSKFQIPSFRVSGAPPWVCRGTPKSRFHVSKCADSRILLCKFQIPSFRVSGAPPWEQGGPQRDPKIQIPCFLMGRFQDTPLQIPDSKIPSVQIPGYSWAYSRFRVSEFPRPPLGSEPKGRPPNSRFRVSEFPRPPLASSVQGRGEGLPNSRFRVSEFPRTPLGSQQDGRTNSQIPSFRV